MRFFAIEKLNGGPEAPPLAAGRLTSECAGPLGFESPRGRKGRECLVELPYGGELAVDGAAGDLRE